MQAFRKSVSLLRAIGHRADSWYNNRLGYGTSDDPTTALQFQAPDRIAAVDLEAYYTGDSLAHKIVSAIVDDAARQGWQLTSESQPAIAEKIHNKMQSLWDYQSRIMQWGKEARLYGGVGVFVRASDNTEWTDGAPLRPESVQKLCGFDLLRPRDLQDESTDTDPLSRNFGKPLTYQIHLQHPNGATYTGHNIHHSRVIRIDHGIKLTERIRRNKNDLFSESVLLPVLCEIERYRTAFAAINSMMSNASQPVYKIKNLLSILSTEGGEALLRERFNVIETVRSTLHAILLDSDGEDFMRVATPMSELANLIDRYMLAIAQAAGMPLTRLFGMSPAGLNATGDADIRQWYDTVQAYRELHLEPLIKQFINFASMDPNCPDIPEDCQIAWPSLWQLSPTELAAVRQQVATADVAYVNSGVFSAEEIALVRSQENGWALDVQLDERTLRDVDDPTGVPEEASKPPSEPAADIPRGRAAGEASARLREAPREPGTEI